MPHLNRLSDEKFLRLEGYSFEPMLALQDLPCVPCCKSARPVCGSIAGPHFNFRAKVQAQAMTAAQVRKQKRDIPGHQGSCPYAKRPHPTLGHLLENTSRPIYGAVTSKTGAAILVQFRLRRRCFY